MPLHRHHIPVIEEIPAAGQSPDLPCSIGESGNEHRYRHLTRWHNGRCKIERWFTPVSIPRLSDPDVPSCGRFLEPVDGHQCVLHCLQEVYCGATPQAGMDLPGNELWLHLHHRLGLLFRSDESKWKDVRSGNALVLGRPQLGRIPRHSLLRSSLVRSSYYQLMIGVPYTYILTQHHRVAIGASITIYTLAGREIFQKRRELLAFRDNDNDSSLENPFTAYKTTEIHVTSELAEYPIEANIPHTHSRNSIRLDPQSKSMSNCGWQQYSVSISKGPKVINPFRYDGGEDRSGEIKANNVALEANAAAWGYTKCALLFFVSLLITWVSSLLLLIIFSISILISIYRSHPPSSASIAWSTTNRATSHSHTPQVLSCP